MSVTEETLRLNWEQKGEAVIDEANARLRETEAELQKLRILYGLGSVAEDDYAAATAKLAQQKRELKNELAAYEKLAAPATDKTRNLGRGVLELSRAFEDAQYGLHGVLNNIPTTIQMFGGPAGLAAAVSLVAVGAKVLYDHWDDLARAFETKTPFPDATRDLGAMDRELERAKDAMEELEKNSSLTASELEKYNGLRAQAADIEKRIADEKERQKQSEALDKLKPATEEEMAKERARALQETLGGQQEDLTNKVQDASGKAKLDAVQKDAEEARQAYEALAARKARGLDTSVDRQGAAHDLDDRLKEAEDKYKILSQAVDAEAAARRQRAKDLVGDAILKGDAKAAERLAQTPGLTDYQRAMIAQSDPKAAREEARYIESQRRAAKLDKDLAERKAKADKAAGEQAKKDHDLAVELTNQGLENERQMRAEEAKAAGKDAKAGAAAAKKDNAAAVKDAEAFGHRAAAEAKSAGSGGLEKQAEFRLNQLMTEGLQTRRGLVRMTREQALNQVVQELQGVLARERGITGFHGLGLAQGIAGNAQADLQQRMLGVGLQGLGAQQKGLVIAQQLSGELGQLARGQNALVAGYEQIQREITNRRRPAGRRVN